jgi:hypothetical protein
MLVFFVNRCGDEKSNNESMEESDGTKSMERKS